VEESERLLAGLNDAQRWAVQVEAEPLCVLAGAGSGKTRVLTRRIAWRIGQGSVSPGHALALTFTRKAAGELRSRLARLGIRDQVAAGTFHAVALAQLRRRWADTSVPPPVILERKGPLLARLVSRDRAGASRQVTSSVLSDLAAEIEWAKARTIVPSAYAAAASEACRRAPLPLDHVARVFAAYEQEKNRRGLVDFDDLLLALRDAMEEDPAFLAAQRWRFRHFFVDEFQDVNPAQAQVLDAWLGDRLDLCVVGDPNQAIYSWNGADPSRLAELPERYPSATIVRLDDNYRSTPQILAVAGAVMAQGRSRANATGLRANRADGPIPTLVSYDDDAAEARGVARHLRRAHAPGRSWSHMAVLARTNAQLVLLEEALTAADIPFRVSAGAAFLDLPEVREAMELLAQSPPGVPFSSCLADVQELVQRTNGRGEWESGGAEEARQHLEALVRLAREYEAVDPLASAQGFLAWLRVAVRSDRPTGGDAVELATFHRAKGLEWPIVFVTGLERGLVPIGHAVTAAAEAEERRLLYVAVTRAEEELHCSWAQRRTFGARTVQRTSSPYIGPIEGVRRALERGARPADLPSWVAAERTRLVASSRASRAPAAALAEGSDPDLLEALRTWRKETARSAGVPAFVILHDATLAAVAAARPSTHEELLTLPGLGPVKASRYGDELLDLVAREVSA
jgi:DNA helicase-2/ATP-dependent DNA helicase PcrA